MLDKVTAKGCKKIIGTDATVTVMDGPDVVLKVLDVIEHDLSKEEDERPAECRKDPFTLVLSGSKDLQVKDGTYDLTLEKIGLLEGVFIDNKSDNPESEDYNSQQEKEAAEQFKKDKTEAAEAGTAQPEATFAPEQRILYDVVFG